MKESSEPLIVLIGCQELEKPFIEKGYSPLVLAQEEALSGASELAMPRAVVLRSIGIVTMSAEELIEKLRERWPIVDIVVWAPRSSGDLVLGVMKAGAKDVILVQDPHSVIERVARVIEDQKILPRVVGQGNQPPASEFEGMISRDLKMWDLFAQIEQVAETDATVLVLGETGTGKELVARAIHKLSGRRGRFVAVNCAAIPEILIDSELFGHVKGAFTGAAADKKGLFRYAEDGTLFLDEIGNMPLNAQYHLLRVLQESTIRPVGAHAEVSVNARVLAATSRPLEEYIKAGKFREDLLYRLDVFRLVVPSLRERPEDIPYLFSHFARKFTKQYGLSFPSVTDAFLDALGNYPWPGNVRQLANITERLILTHHGEKLSVRHFNKVRKPYDTKEALLPREDEEEDLTKTLEETLSLQTQTIERRYLVAQLKAHHGHITEAAKAAGISRRTLHRKIKRFGIDISSLKKEWSS